MALLLLTATDLEQGRLVAALEDAVRVDVAGRSWHRGRIYGEQVQVAATGIGAVNTAHAVTRALEMERYEAVLQIGVGGAYPGAGAAVGDMAIATDEAYGDLGVVTPDGWRPADEIGIPVARVDGVERYNRFPTDPTRTAAAAAMLRQGFPALTWHTGPFVTVQACSGTAALGGERAARVPGALCENMEGAAAAHVCALYGAPFVEIRGISNLVEDRDLSRWKLALAAERAQVAALALLAEAEIHRDQHPDRPNPSTALRPETS